MEHILASGGSLIRFLFAICGHLALWSAIFNQIHATAWNRPLRKVIEKLIYAAVVGLGLLLIVSVDFQHVAGKGNPQSQMSFMSAYAIGCILFWIVMVIHWLYRKVVDQYRVDKHSTTHLHVGHMIRGNLLHGWQANLLRWVPGNQVLDLVIEYKSLTIDGLPDSLNNLRIAHVSDLHFTGKIDSRYFEEVVKQVNLLEADFVCLTGDIVDEQHCLPWIKSVLAGVTAKYGKLFVLGNHDCRIKDEALVRQLMRDSGWTDPDGDWQSYQIGAATISFAGNEAPWFNQGLATPQRTAARNELLVLLSHSPDQFDWARQRKIKLMLAGHTHGGQIRFPFVGPIIAPSHHGVRYASGVFKQGGTLMHVSRGVSGDDPIRWNCPPELTLITLQ